MGGTVHPEELESRLGCDISARKHQILATFSATLGSFGLGTVLGWTSPALPDLKHNLDLQELSNNSSWIASLAILGALVSGPPAGFLINKVGRRLTMMTMAIPFAMGWGLMASATKIPMLMYVGRFITGFCGGTFTVTVPVYVNEIAEESFRGVLGSVMVLMLVSGILFSFILGTFVSWLSLSIICGFCPILMLVMMTFMPETPTYLLMKTRFGEGMRALEWLRNCNDERLIELEFLQIKESILTTADRSEHWKQALAPHVVKPALICTVLMFFQQLGGINGVTMYTVDIFKSAGPHIDPNIASIIIGIVQVVFVMSSMLLVERLGRKLLLICSCVLMSASLYLLGYFFYNKEQNTAKFQESNLTWIPMVTLITFIIAYSFGMGPIPWLLISEILSPAFKGEISALVTMTYWTLAFFATKTFQDMIDVFNESGCYWIYASVCLMGAFFSYVFVPETKGKSREQIQQYFGDQCGKERRDGEDCLSQYSSVLERDSNRNETKKALRGDVNCLEV